MSDELKLEAPKEEVVPQTETVVETSVVNESESQALEQGWRPKDEWVANGGDPDEWKPAKLFLKDGELYKSIHSTKRELKQTQAVLQTLQKHHQMVFEKAHLQALRDLKQERRAALRTEDIDAVEKVEQEIEKLQDDHVKEMQQFQQTTQAAQTATGGQVEFESFVQRNPWYASDKGMRDEADAIGFIYLNNGGNKDTLLPHVEKEIRRKFPEKFGVKRAAPNAVAPVSKGTTRQTKESVDLSDSEREIMNTFVRSGVMSKEQYMADLKKIKERN